MKLTSLAIIFIVIILPFLFISGQQSEIVKEDSMLRNYYDTAVDNAVQDAAFMLSQYSGELSYSEESIASLKDLAVKSFFDSLYQSFNVYGSPHSMARVELCVPVLMFLEDDGFTLYAINSYKNSEGFTEIKHSWLYKKHYIGDNLYNRYSVRYTLNDYIYIFDIIDEKLYEGEYSDFEVMIPFFNDEEMFEDIKINAIRQSIEKEFSAYMGKYNKWTNNGLLVDLKFPAIDDGDWKRAITDEGLLVFAQGFPVLSGQKYEHYALGCSRVIRKASIVGYIFQGKSYYCKLDCNVYRDEIVNDPTYDSHNLIYFTDAFEAASQGYYPCPYCRP